MAKLKMKDYTNAILIEPPRNAWGIQTVKIKGSDLYPGHPVTQTDETVPEVVSPASLQDVFYGILLCAEGHGLDVIYTAGDFVPCLMAGSGGACWTWLKAAESTVQVGTRVHAEATGTYCVILESMLYENVGLVIEYSATDASDDRPIKVVLSG